MIQIWKLQSAENKQIPFLAVRYKISQSRLIPMMIFNFNKMWNFKVNSKSKKEFQHKKYPIFLRDYLSTSFFALLG